MSQKILKIKCPGEDCGKQFTVNMPAKAGIYVLQCPHCHHRTKVRMPGLSDSGNPQKTEDAAASSRTEGPDNSSKEVLPLSDGIYFVDQEYKVECPHCGAKEIDFKPAISGTITIACPKCKGLLQADVFAKTKPISGASTQALMRARLKQLRKFMKNRIYELKVGTQTVGRYSQEEPSDFMVKNDPSMSRRSVKIEMNLTEDGYSYKMTVLNATNPVLHNNVPLLKGESVSLNFGDSIILGKTQFRFEKS